MKKMLMMFAVVLATIVALADTWKDPETGITWTYSVRVGEVIVKGAEPTRGSITIPSMLGGFPVTTIGEYAFDECTGLTNVTIPSSVKTIGDEAFSRCSGLTEVTIPSSVTSIGVYAFERCTGLTSVTIPASVTSIWEGTFEGCSGLTSVTIPSSVTSIGVYAFERCTGLTSVTIPSSVTSIGEWAFIRCSSLANVTISEGVTIIGNEAFYECTGLTSVTIPSSVMTIGDEAFYSCSSLTNVTISEGVTTIGREAFYECTGLTSVTIPSSVTTIGSEAFSGCSSLTNVIISEGVAVIASGAFALCTGLTSVTIPSSVTTIWDGTFLQYGTFMGCSGLQFVEVDADNARYSSQEGVVFNKNKTFLVLCPEGKCGAYTIPSSVTRIGEGAFYCCFGLTSVTIPSGVKAIDSSALSYLDVVDFEGAPPEGLVDAGIEQDAAVRYNVAYEAQWLPVIEQCGWTNAESYVPDPRISGVTAQQRYPWNGLVDIVVTLECVTAEELTLTECSFAATNSAAGASIPVTSITQKGDDTGSGTTWTRRFVWDAAKNVGAIKIDDVALTVDAKVVREVQLWEGGPYWAKCNLGATKPEEYGYYFWWGDTVGYKRNAADDGWISVKDGSSFSFTSGNCPTYGKFDSELQSAGYINSMGNLVATHDAATAHLGAPWRLPTVLEFDALISNCTTTWTMRGGVYGRLVTGRGAYASKSIFLPAAGNGDGSALDYDGLYGGYWSSTRNSDSYLSAYSLYFGSGYLKQDYVYTRYGGLSVRPLRGFADGAMSDGQMGAGVTTHLKLDCQTGTRTAAETETITYSTAWVEGAGEGAVAVVLVNGKVINDASGSGTVNWTPTHYGTNTLTHQVMVGGSPVGETLWAKFVTRPFPEGGPYTEIVDGIEWTFMVDADLNVSVGTGSVSGTAISKDTAGDIVIPAELGGRTVTAIGQEAFYCCKAITGVTIPPGVTSIGKSAFGKCVKLEDVMIPASVTNIGICAFSGDCESLTWIDVEAENDCYSAQDGVLFNKDKTELIQYPGAKAGTYTIPESVEHVGVWAFQWCHNLEWLTVPTNVTSMAESAFFTGKYAFAIDFEGAPQDGIRDAFINSASPIRYNVAYKGDWERVAEDCQWTNATPYVPFPIPERGIVISFVAPNGESSMERAYFATNRPYGRLPLARREGCTFAGWYTSLDGTERVGAFDEVLPDVKTLYARWAEDEAPLYAQWDPNHYSAVFNPDGGTGEMEAQPFIYDQRQALTANAFKKTGYTFKGWATNEAGEVIYADQQVVSNLTAEAGFAVALFAKWEQIMDITEEEIEEWVTYDLAPTYKKPGETKTGYVKRFEERFGDDYTKAFYSETGKIGQDGTALCVYHDYIAGTDPLDKDSRFTASITFDESGKPVVTYDPVLSEEKAALRIYTTYGKQNLADAEWSVVQPGQEADYRFFKVTIEMRPKN